MLSLDEFLKNTHPKGHCRKMSDEHKIFLSSLYPSYPLSFQVWFYRQGYTAEPRCAVCGGILNKATAKTCSIDCREQLHKQEGTHKQSREKAKQTCLEKYGVTNVAQLAEVQEARIQSNIKKYGSKVSDKTRKKAKERANELNVKGRATLKERHGVNNPGQLAGHRDKCAATFIEKTGVDHFTKTAEYKQKKAETKHTKWTEKASGTVKILSVTETTSEHYTNPNDRIEFLCNICTTKETLPSETFKWRINQGLTPCSKCNGLAKGSAAEQEIADFLSQHTTVIRNTRALIPPQEIDIFLPDLNVAIEYNGLFWHHDLRVNKNYHLNKTNACADKGIRLIHIFEDEWVRKQDIVKSRLLGVLCKNKKIYARHCAVHKIGATEANAFLNKHHIQGVGRANEHYGLKHQGELVAVMTFLRGDISKKIKGWELNRFCSALGTNIVGGGSKLMARFIADYNPTDVVSFADRRWSSLDPFYSKLGFSFVHNSRPNYWYFQLVDMIRKHRFGFRSGDISESEKSKDYLRIWDCGSSKWVWTQK